MRFAPTDEQVELRCAARAMLSKECPAKVVRAAWVPTSDGLGPGPWKGLEDMGALAALAVPPAGLGLGECDVIGAIEETGYFALPHPIVETMMVAAPLGVFGMVATDLGGPVVPCAGDAEVLLLLADSALRVYQPDEVELVQLTTTDAARRAARVAPRGGGVLVTSDPGDVDRARLRGTLGVAAQLIGLSRRMLDMTAEYVRQRHQFGVPVGAFQAVKHHLANALLRIEFGAPALLRAAHSLQIDAPTAARDVSMAKVLATDAASFTGGVSLQCHGAIGYTTEYDLHLLIKRASALIRTWGDRASHVALVAESIKESS